MTDSKDPQDFHPIPGVAHDIRQMLAVIAGRISLLLERRPDAELERHLLAVQLAAADAAAMLKRLPGTGADSDPVQAANLRQVAQDSGGLMLFPDQDWILDSQVAEDLWAEVPAQVLREVINNLLLNARAAMPGGGTITVTGSAEAARVRLRVEDTGPGVAPALRDKIFTPGFSTSGQPGRGLGLAGCRLLLQRFGGRLELASGPGPGAAFLLDLPLAAGRPGPCGEEAAGADSLEPGEILVVDDEIAVQEMMADLLGELGWKPVVVSSAEQAQSVFSPGRFPVVLVDQTLPGMSGLELASDLRGKDRNIVLVLVTGWGNEDIISRAQESGLDFTAEKPLTVGKIRQLLGQAAVLLKVRSKEREES